jgi:hypothetical protein
MDSRQITAANKVLDGIDSSRESVALSAIAETVACRHVLEKTSDPDYKRRGQRLIIYPKFSSKFSLVMTTGNVGLDVDGGHDIAYQRIISERMT